MGNIAIIPARGGSKGILRKNIKIVAGKPLVVWSIEACLESKAIDSVVVSTDDQEIFDIAKSFGAIPYMRPKHLGKDNVHSIYVVLNYLNYCKKEGIIINRVAMILPTAPLKTANDIDSAFDLFDNKCFDSIISVKEYDRPISCIRKLQNGVLIPVIAVDKFETQRQELRDKLYEVNGSVYISTPEHLKNTKSFHQGRVGLYIMSNINSVDINNIDDLKIAEALLWQRQKIVQSVEKKKKKVFAKTVKLNIIKSIIKTIKRKLQNIIKNIVRKIKKNLQ